MTAYHDTIERALRAGHKLHAFLSGGGLRVVRIRKGGKEKGYGEHPHIEDAMSHAAEDFLAGGRPYNEVYGGSKPHYLTGASTPSTRLDAWVRGGRDFDAHAVDNIIVVTLPTFVEDTPKPPDLAERVKAEGVVLWESRGYRFESSPFVFANGEVGYSSRCLDEGVRDAFHFAATRTGQAARLVEAIELALDAEPVEVKRG